MERSQEPLELEALNVAYHWPDAGKPRGVVEGTACEVMMRAASASIGSLQRAKDWLLWGAAPNSELRRAEPAEYRAWLEAYLSADPDHTVQYIHSPMYGTPQQGAGVVFCAGSDRLGHRLIGRTRERPCVIVAEEVSLSEESSSSFNELLPGGALREDSLLIPVCYSDTLPAFLEEQLLRYTMHHLGFFAPLSKLDYASYMEARQAEFPQIEIGSQALFDHSYHLIHNLGMKLATYGHMQAIFSNYQANMRDGNMSRRERENDQEGRRRENAVGILLKHDPGLAARAVTWWNMPVFVAERDCELPDSEAWRRIAIIVPPGVKVACLSDCKAKIPMGFCRIDCDPNDRTWTYFNFDLGSGEVPADLVWEMTPEDLRALHCAAKQEREATAKLTDK